MVAYNDIDKMLRKKKPECLFYYSIYRKLKSRQSESVVIKFRSVVIFGEVFPEKRAVV